MTDERLAELEKLANEATPGWWAWADEGFRRMCIGAADECGSPIEGDDTHGPRCEVLEEGLMRYDDASFIVAARTALPELIAEVRQLRDALAATEKTFDLMDRDFRESQRALAECERDLADEHYR